MALQDTAILWNKLGSNAQVTSSEIGPDFTISGTPTYEAAKFDNGIKIDANSEEVELTTDATFDLAQGAVGVWIKTGYSVTDGVPSDASRHDLVDIRNMSTGQERILMILLSDRMRFVIVSGGVTTIFDLTTDVTWSADTLTYLLFVYDNSAASKKRIVYIGDASSISEIGSSSATWNDNDISGIQFTLGNNTFYTDPWDGIIDNIKYFNDASTANVDLIKDNRNTEGWAVAPAPTPSVTRSFRLRTSDGTYDKTETQFLASALSAEIGIENNNIYADVINYTRKKQKGRTRTVAIISGVVSQSDYDNFFLAGKQYNDYWIIDFDRLIPANGTATGNFNFEDLRIIQDINNEYEIEAKFTEVIDPI
jgi:hypothetical protein